ncbi:MAG: hypothetical protein J1E35_03595 [Lachnospiraceae bacterium]|nr:hypothetical protein [Lachnospiraceae bacterium]
MKNNFWKYLYIGFAILVLALVLFFGIEKAEAAQSITVQYMGEDYEIPLDDTPYYVVFYDVFGSVGNTRVFLSSSPLVGTGSASSVSFSTNENPDIITYGMSNGFGKVTYRPGSSVSLGTSGFSTYNSNYSVLSSKDGSVLLPARPLINYSFTYQGNLYTDVWYFAKNEPYHVPYDKRQVSVLFNILGAVPKYAITYPEDSFKLTATFTYYLPHPDYVLAWLANGKTADELLLPVTRKPFADVCMKEGSGVEFTSTLEIPITYEVLQSGEVRYRIDVLESALYDATVRQSGINWQSFYGLTDSQWSIYKDAIFGYTVFAKMSTVLYAKDSAVSYVYGGLYTVNVLDQKNFLSTYIDKEPDDVTPDEQTQAERDKLGELLGNANGTIEDLKEQLKASQDTLSYYDEKLDGSGLWDTFRGIAVGFTTITGSFRAIGMSIGNIFSFLPGDVYSLMFFTLVATCVIALFKTMK